MTDEYPISLLGERTSGVWQDTLDAFIRDTAQQGEIPIIIRCGLDAILPSLREGIPELDWNDPQVLRGVMSFGLLINGWLQNPNGLDVFLGMMFAINEKYKELETNQGETK